MDSDTRITLREGSLKEPLPESNNGLGWVQIQQKSSRWEEHIQGSTIITHEGLTTLAHPNRGWTVANGTWNVLRAKWGLTSETLQKIYDCCKTQRQLETDNIFTPNRTHSTDNQAGLAGGRNTWTPSGSSAHLLSQSL
jgi:hypothetical protein